MLRTSVASGPGSADDMVLVASEEEGVERSMPGGLVGVALLPLEDDRGGFLLVEGVLKTSLGSSWSGKVTEEA